MIDVSARACRWCTEEDIDQRVHVGVIDPPVAIGVTLQRGLCARDGGEGPAEKQRQNNYTAVLQP